MKHAVILLATLVVSGCATQKGNDRHAQHAADQIRMVAIQQQSRVQEANADAQADRALVEALAEVARANPDHAPAVTVALAVIGVRGQGGDDADVPVVTLQRQQNEALEWTKALAPTVGGLVTGLGVAAIQADVQKNASDNMARININDADSDVAIVQAVAGLGTAAANSVGMSVAGDYMQVSDNGLIDQSVTTTETNSTVATTTNTSESANTTTLDSSTSYDATDEGFIVNGNYDYDFVADSTVTYGGQETTMSGILEYLQGLGQPYSLIVDGEVVAQSTEGEGDPVEISCEGPMFSPMPAECT